VSGNRRGLFIGKRAQRHRDTAYIGERPPLIPVAPARRAQPLEDRIQPLGHGSSVLPPTARRFGGGSSVTAAATLRNMNGSIVDLTRIRGLVSNGCRLGFAQSRRPRHRLDRVHSSTQSTSGESPQPVAEVSGPIPSGR
jgi:hypothetical protein